MASLEEEDAQDIASKIGDSLVEQWMGRRGKLLSDLEEDEDEDEDLYPRRGAVGGMKSGGARPKDPYYSGPPFPANVSTPRPIVKQEPETGPRSRARTPTRERTSSQLDLDLLKAIIDSYADALSKTSKDKYKIPPVPTPKYKAGGDWQCFLAEFQEMVRLADLKPSTQLAYLKQTVPEEAKRMLYQHKVESVDQAIQMLTELYEPVKDPWTALQDLQKVNQQSGERLRILAGRIQEAARPIKLPAKELDELVKSRFKHALADQETRNLLLWEQKDLSLEQMIQKAQQFEDSRHIMGNKGKKTLRTKAENSEASSLKKEVTELKQKLSNLEGERTKATSKKPTCWNCGLKGHLSRACKKDKIGNGFTHCPKNRQRKEQEKPRTAENQTQTGNLNWETQGK